MRRTKEQAAETGAQILRAAEALFLEQGYDNVSLEEIAAASGVTRGAVHWHFKNKQGLLLALRDEAQRPFRRLAEELTQDAGAASLDELGDVVAEMFERLENDPRQRGLIKVMMRLDLAAAEQEGGTNFRAEMNALLTPIFEAAARAHGLPAPWTTATAASALGATLGGLVTEWALGKGSLRLVPEGQSFIRMLLGAFGR